jgi:hypothetical protein
MICFGCLGLHPSYGRGTATATAEQIKEATQRIYANYPALLEAALKTLEPFLKTVE